jgi:hypothetical protein
MLKAVHSYLGSNTGVWNGVTANQAAFDALGNSIEAINQAVQSQEDPTEGVTVAKAQVRDALEDQIRLVGDVVFAFAMANNNNELASRVEIKPSELERLSDHRVDDVAVRVHAAGTENLAALGDYGIAQADLDTLDTRRIAFQEAKSEPRVRTAERAGHTATLPQMIRDAKGILRLRLDKLMTRYRLSHPQFYAGYQSARVVVDRRGPGQGEPQAAPAPAPAPAPTP